MSETYSKLTPQQGDTIRILTGKILTVLNNGGGGGGGGNAQLVTYTVGTPANPPNTSKPALAYDPSGNLPTMGWDTVNQVWT